MPPFAKRVVLHSYVLHPLGRVTLRVPDTGIPSEPLASPSCTYLLNTAPRSQMTRPLAAFRYKAPLANACRRPPGTAFCDPAAAPGAHISASYLARMAPVTFRLEPIHTRLSRSPSAALRAPPVMVALSARPTTVIDSIRPETPRTAPENPVTVPMEPVYLASFVVSAASVKVSVHVRTGLALVKSPGSQTPRR